MSKTAKQLYEEGHKNIICSYAPTPYFTKGKVYNICDGVLRDKDGDTWDLRLKDDYPVATHFEPYEFMGMSNKVFTPEEIEELATAVAAKVLEKLKEKL